MIILHLQLYPLVATLKGINNFEITSIMLTKFKETVVVAVVVVVDKGNAVKVEVYHNH